MQSLLRTACSESHVPCFQERVDTGTQCSVRLSWRRRARPSTTLHEIQICGKADWNYSFLTQQLGDRKLPLIRRGLGLESCMDCVVLGSVNW